MKAYNFLVLVTSILLLCLTRCNFTNLKQDADNSRESSGRVTESTVNNAENRIEYDKYVNPRFGFSVLYPVFLTSKFESDNNDGCAFSNNENCKMIASAEYNVLDYSLEELENVYKKDIDGSISYSKKKDNWFVLSGINFEGNIYYLKVVLDRNIEYVIEFIYPKKHKELFDEVIKVVINSLKYNVDNIFDVQDERIQQGEPKLVILENTAEHKTNLSYVCCSTKDIMNDFTKETVFSLDFNKDTKKESIVMRWRSEGFEIMGYKGNYGCEMICFSDDDIEDSKYIQITAYDFDNDDTNEVVISIGTDWDNIRSFVYRINKSDEIPYVLVGQINSQQRVILQNNQLIAPYGSQGLFESYYYIDGKILQERF